MNPSQHPKPVIWACLVLSLTLGACATYSPIPPAEYDGLGKPRRDGYRVTTTDAHVYIVQQLSVEDSTAVVWKFKSVRKDRAYPVEPEDEYGDIPAMPFTIPLGRIASIEKIDIDHISPFLFMGGIVAAYIYVVSRTVITVN